MAITAAMHFTGRRRIVAFTGGYHGGVLGFGTRAAPTTVPFDFLVLPYNDTERARSQIRKHTADIEAVLVEPMLGASGCIPAAPGFLAGLRQATEAGALLIADEVMVSRLATQWLMMKEGIRADLTTLGKYIGRGPCPSARSADGPTSWPCSIPVAESCFTRARSTRS